MEPYQISMIMEVIRPKTSRSTKKLKELSLSEKTEINVSYMYMYVCNYKVKQS